MALGRGPLSAQAIAEDTKANGISRVQKVYLEVITDPPNANVAVTLAGSVAATWFSVNLLSAVH